MLRVTFRLAAAVVAAAFSVSLVSADDTMLKVKAGDKFPNVPLEASSIEKAKAGAKTIGIEDLKGKIVVVFFYPRALTGGCTTESCGFRDIAKDFPQDVVILGASNDKMDKQEEFTKKNSLPYALLCDVESKLIKDLGIMSPKGNAAQRVTFVIGKDGKIAKVYDKVSPATHPKEVLEFVKTLK
jgi:peroxiredoxin Q/BCP